MQTIHSIHREISDCRVCAEEACETIVLRALGLELCMRLFHDRSKHIDIRYHHIKDCVQWKIMLLHYIPTEDQDADILTKALTKRKFEYHRDRIRVKDNPFLVEREC